MIFRFPDQIAVSEPSPRHFLRKLDTEVHQPRWIPFGIDGKRYNARVKTTPFSRGRTLGRWDADVMGVVGLLRVDIKSSTTDINSIGSTWFPNIVSLEIYLVHSIARQVLFCTGRWERPMEEKTAMPRQIGPGSLLRGLPRSERRKRRNSSGRLMHTFCQSWWVVDDAIYWT